MGPLMTRAALLCMLILLQGSFLLGQHEGESEVTTISLKKSDSALLENEALRSVKDTLPPLIQIISPRLNDAQVLHLTSSTSYLIGRVSDESDLSFFSINDSIIPLDEEGFFQLHCPLSPGLNTYRLFASDELSNTVNSFVYLVRDKELREPQSSHETEYPGTFYALLIANNNYEDPALPDLDNPISDATLLYSTLLGNYSFEPEHMILLKNATRAEIIRTMDRLSEQLSEQDNLVIFYAGHGKWDGKKETGYWLPVDADRSSSVNWIRNSTIQDYVDDINTRHTLLITDACFAGSIFKTRGAFPDAPVAINKLYSLKSRKAMTSGNLKEVPDKSVFLEELTQRLLENEKNYISSAELFYEFREAVLNNSPNTPLYQVIHNTGDEGGEFIFIKR